MSEEKAPTVLCVDDDEDIRDFISAVLMQHGYRVETADCGAKALQAVKASAPDVVLLDVMMPDMDGYTVCAQLQEDPGTSGIPVIFVTGRTGERDQIRALQAGGADYLAKPINEGSLSEKVKAHLGTKQRWQQIQTVENATKPTDVRTAPARWDAKLRPSEFTKFKEAMAAGLKLPTDKKKVIVKAGAGELFTKAQEAGLDEAQVMKAMSKHLSFPLAEGVNADDVRLGVFPSSFCKSHHIVPILDGDGKDAFVLSNPFEWEVLEALKRVLDRTQTPRLMLITPGNLDKLLTGEQRPASGKPKAELSDIAAQLEKEYSPIEEVKGVAADSDELSAPIIDLVNKLIETAHKKGASDIHVEPQEEEILVRYRIDGDLHIMNRLKPASLIRPITARIKIMSDLDIAEKRLPQDGRIKFKNFTRRRDMDIDLRVATAPQNWGEKVCMRILDKQKSVMPLSHLGFSARNLEKYRSKIESPYGMILHVGPTGSGKSMTLYAALNEIQDSALNIQTAEDPIEYTLPGINQMQMNSDIGLNFKRALRSFLRLDPDVILVGEIRDLETANISIEASLTGHLLLSTLHTNDAASTVTRFIEMGVEPYMVSSALLLICAQRLLRRLCKECKTPYEPNAAECERVGIPDGEKIKLFKANGCEKCNNLGYRGRVGVHEVMMMNDPLRTAINSKGVTAESLKRLAVEGADMTTLWWDSMEKVRQGLCSVEDTLANVRPDEFDSRPAWMKGQGK